MSPLSFDLDIVTGKPYFRSSRVLRAFPGQNCGAEARWFEPKETTKEEPNANRGKS